MFAGRELWIVLALAGCSPAPKPAPPAESVGTYWLEDTQLLDSGSVHGVRVLDAREVMIRADRNVEDAATGVHLGLLPEQLMNVPAAHGGVLLYAQEVTPIHLDKPNGKEVGRLYPGARVSVTRGVGASTELNQLGFERWDPDPKEPARIKAFATRSALSSHKLPEYLFPPIPNAQVLQSLAITYSEQQTGFKPLNCVDLIFDPDRPVQQRQAVEIEFAEEWRLKGHGFTREGRCGSTEVTASGAGFNLSPKGVWGKPPIQVSSIPPGFNAVQAPLPDPLESVIRSKGKLYWMMEYIDHVECEEWSVREPTERTPYDYHYDYAVQRLERDPPYRWRDQLQGELVRTEKGYRGEVPYYPFTYWSATVRDPARMLLEPVRHGCRCWDPGDYGIVDREGDTLFVQDSPPRNTAAYLRSEAERWFLTRATCDATLANALERLKTDGRLKNQLGFRVEPYLPSRTASW
ncbi:MAG: hypothetical protein R3B07_20015 [Polyangiaceae bacterium]